MKKMIPPKQLALPYFIGKVALVLSTFLLLTSATMLIQAPQPRVPFPDFQNSPLPVSDFVERYDALMINDPTAVFLDAEAEYLAGIVQRVLGYTGVFKTYEFRMYGPSLIANGEIAFETAAGSFADKIENGGVVAVRGKGGQPELRKVTQNAYYLMIAMQAQGGNAVKFKVVLKLPKKAGVSDAEHGILESTLARLGESALQSTWGVKKIIDQASIAESDGVRKIADMLSNWVPGQGLPASDARSVLESNGFLLQKLDCSSYSVNENLSGTEGSVKYFSQITLKGAQNNLRSANQTLPTLINSQITNALHETLGFDVYFVVTSDRDFGTTDWTAADQAFADKSKKMIVWLHFSHSEAAVQQLTESVGECSVALKVQNNLSKEELKNTVTKTQPGGIDSWLNWRAKKEWLNNPTYSTQSLYGTTDESTLIAGISVGKLEFGFGTVSGMIDNLLDQISSLEALVQLTITNLKEAKEVTTATLYLTGAWLVDLIKWNILNDYNNWLIDGMGLFDEAENLQDNLAAYSDYLYDQADEWFNRTTAMNAIWTALKGMNVKSLINSFVNDIFETLGDMFSKSRWLGYGAGQLVMDFAISWLTAGGAAVAKNVYSKLGDALLDIFNSTSNGAGMARKLGEAIEIPTVTLSKTEKAASCARQLGCFVTGTLVLTTLGAQPIEALNPATPIPVYQAASTSTSYDPGTTTEFGIQALNATHTLPGDVQDIDREEITPATWRWLHLSYTKPDGTTAQVYLRRPL